jgi:UrcA family protein
MRRQNSFFPLDAGWHGTCRSPDIGNQAGSGNRDTTMQTIKNRSLAAFGAVLATFATVAAASPARAETRTVVMSFSGVDLGSASGQATVDRRIRTAAIRVCGPMEFRSRNQILACRRDAIANAKVSLAGVDRPVMVAAR